MKVVKFLIPQGRPRVIDTYPNGSTLEAEGLYAGALAETVDEARELLTRIATEEGIDARWLNVAKVIELDITTPKRLFWVEL